MNDLNIVNKKEFGRLFSEASDEVQAEILNAIGYSFKTSTFSGNTDGQFVYISNKLDKNGMDFISSLSNFVNLRREHELPKTKKTI